MMEDAHLIMFEARLSGVVNGQYLSLVGQGTIDEHKGITRGSYDLSHICEDIPRCVLTACLITGYPNASSTPSGFDNPFKGKSYDYDRSIYFSEKHFLQYHTSVTIQGRNLLSCFVLNGSVPSFRSPKYFSQFIEEEWVDHHSPMIGGRFTAQWLSQDSEYLIANCRTSYRVADHGLVSAVNRSIKIEYSEENDLLSLFQCSRLSQ